MASLIAKLSQKFELLFLTSLPDNDVQELTLSELYSALEGQKKCLSLPEVKKICSGYDIDVSGQKSRKSLVSKLLDKILMTALEKLILGKKLDNLEHDILKVERDEIYQKINEEGSCYRDLIRREAVCSSELRERCEDNGGTSSENGL
jgi:hypothetical protein